MLTPLATNPHRSTIDSTPKSVQAKMVLWTVLQARRPPANQWRYDALMKERTQRVGKSGECLEGLAGCLGFQAVSAVLCWTGQGPTLHENMLKFACDGRRTVGTLWGRSLLSFPQAFGTKQAVAWMAANRQLMRLQGPRAGNESFQTWWLRIFLDFLSSGAVQQCGCLWRPPCSSEPSGLSSQDHPRTQGRPGPSVLPRRRSYRHDERQGLIQCLSYVPMAT